MEKFTFLDKLVFRTPTFSFSQRNDKLTIKNFGELLYLASPTLTQEFDKLEKNQVKEEKEKKKITESLHKYHSRSYSRCTPFGLFAGVGTCSWGEKTNLVLSETKRRETRLDMNYVCALGQYLTSVKEIRDQLLYFPNNSVYNVADKIRYVDYKYINTKRSHQISEVDSIEQVTKVLKAAATGATIKDLAQCIVDDDINFNEAHDFILEIISAQLLKNELEPNVTGDNYFDILLRKLVQLNSTVLKEFKPLENIIALLREADRQVKQIDANFSNSVDAYINISALLKQLPVKFEENNLFQTDLYLNTTADQVNKKLQTDLLDCFTLLNKLSKKPSETRLAKFAEEYYKRYEDAELPLLFVLDTEIGTGYAGNKGSDTNPLIEGVIPQQRVGEDSSINFNGKDLILQQKLKEAFLDRKYEVEITDEDFKDLPSDTNDLPPALCASFSLYAKDKIMLSYIGGPGAAAMLGRFAGGDKEVSSLCSEIIAHENSFYPDKIIAEIVHLPESRTGNILMRPAFREYEIPYLANPSVDNEHTIEVSDLYVSVSGKHVTLRSKKLNKQIIPRLTNAHNFSFNALPLYQFLCDLQSQNLRAGFSFQWGSFSTIYQFKPRAIYKNIILKEASWDFKKTEIAELTEKGYDKNAIKTFRQKWQLPDRVLLTDSDNTLLVDWNDELSVNTFLATVKKRSSFTLTEHIFDLDNPAIVNSENQPYENEFLAFIKNNTVPSSRTFHKKNSASELKRYFPVGSEWLYYKIYTGVKTADRVISEHIRPAVEKLQQEGVIDKWFFIRYADPDKHLRVRFHITDLSKYGTLVNTISENFNKLIETGLAWKIQTDTYAREIERYGFNTMELCETYFYHDSNFVADVVGAIEGEEGEKIRWITGFRAVDELLNTFGFSIESKKDFMNRLAENFGREHGMNKNLRVMLDKKFRDLRKEIELNLDRKNDEVSDIKPIWDFLSKKTLATKPITEEIITLQKTNNLAADFESLIGSIIHMLLNRLFKSQQRVHELVTYDLLHAYYKSVIARSKKINPQLSSGSIPS